MSWREPSALMVVTVSTVGRRAARDLGLESSGLGSLMRGFERFVMGSAAAAKGLAALLSLRILEGDGFSLFVMGQEVGDDLGGFFLAEHGLPGGHALHEHAGGDRVVDFLRRAAVDPGLVGEIGPDGA